MLPPFKGQPSNPVGYGVANFLSSFTNSLDDKKKEDDRLREKQAYYDYLEKITGEKLAGQQKVAGIRNQGKAASAAGKLSASDKFFVDNFTKKRNKFLTDYAQPYRDPSIMKNMAMAQRLQTMTPEQRDQLAEVEYGKDDPEGHDLISNPENIAHYKQIMQSLRGGAQQSATTPIGGAQAPQTSQFTAPANMAPSVAAPPIATPPEEAQ